MANRIKIESKKLYLTQNVIISPKYKIGLTYIERKDEGIDCVNIVNNIGAYDFFLHRIQSEQDEEFTEEVRSLNLNEDLSNKEKGKLEGLISSSKKLTGKMNGVGINYIYLTKKNIDKFQKAREIGKEISEFYKELFKNAETVGFMSMRPVHHFFP